jgi:hypothetical protein
MMDMYKNPVFLKQSSDLNKTEEEFRILNKARNVKMILDKSEDEVELREAIKYAHFYIQFDFIKESLMSLYRRSKSEEVKQTIMDLYNGTLDVSTQAEIIEMLKDADVVREAIEEAKEAFINDYLGLDSESISAESGALKSVKLSQFNS